MVGIFISSDIMVCRAIVMKASQIHSGIAACANRA